MGYWFILFILPDSLWSRVTWLISNQPLSHLMFPPCPLCICHGILHSHSTLNVIKSVGVEGSYCTHVLKIQLWRQNIYLFIFQHAHGYSVYFKASLYVLKQNKKEGATLVPIKGHATGRYNFLSQIDHTLEPTPLAIV